MKVLGCKNCGAKYQINDNDFAFYYECSSCAGELEVLESYPNKNNFHEFNFSFNNRKNLILVRCEDCGLKYVIKKNESILDYECAGCGGSLRYLNPDMDRQLDKLIQIKKMELSYLKRYPRSKPAEKHIYDGSYFIKSIEDRFENYFSPDEIRKAADEEKKIEQLKSQKTVKTSIPQNTLKKYDNEFRLPQSDDYDILKEFLKNEFFKNISQFYPPHEEPTRLIDKIRYAFSFNHDEKGILDEEEDELFSFSLNDLTMSHYIVFVGVIIIILSIICLIFSTLEIGLLFSILGLSIFSYGLFRREENPKTFHRMRIIRQYLLSLPKEYYLFYNVKIPNASVGINHVIIGPTGIYAIISEKFDPEKDFNTNKDLKKLIQDTSENKDIKINNNLKYFRFAMGQYPYSSNNAIKRKALLLTENLIDFLNKNNIEILFVEPLVGFINDDLVVINMPLIDEDLFIDEMMHIIKNSSVKLTPEMIDKCAVLLSKYSEDCSFE